LLDYTRAIISVSDLFERPCNPVAVRSGQTRGHVRDADDGSQVVNYVQPENNELLDKPRTGPPSFNGTSKDIDFWCWRADPACWGSSPRPMLHWSDGFGRPRLSH